MAPSMAAKGSNPTGLVANALTNVSASPQSLYMLAGMGMREVMRDMPKLMNGFLDLQQASQGGNQQEPGALPTPAEPPMPGSPQSGGPPPGGMPPGMPPGMGAPPPMAGPPGMAAAGPPGLPPQVLAMLRLALQQRMMQ